MTSYSGKHAEYYDIFYQDKPYAAEASFVHECLQRFAKLEGKRLLELACGTGNHAFELEKRGYQLLATDYSEDLLNVARAKQGATNSQVDFRLADMRSLSMDEAPFDGAICLFDSIGYVQTDEALSQTLKGIANNLLSGGLFIFEFWHAPALLRHYEPLRLRRWQIPEGELLRISSTRLDEAKNLAHVTYDIYDLREDQTYTSLSETQVNRFFTVQEMEQFLQSNGFEALTWLNGYTWDDNINEQTWHVLAVARRI